MQLQIRIHKQGLCRNPDPYGPYRGELPCQVGKSLGGICTLLLSDHYIPHFLTKRRPPHIGQPPAYIYLVVYQVLLPLFPRKCCTAYSSKPSSKPMSTALMKPSRFLL